MRATDGQSGVDPLSLVFNYNGNVLVGASAYDPVTGLVLFVIPAQAPAVKAGKKKTVTLIASDNQETKNVNTIGANILPNTTYKSVKLAVIQTPTVAWLVPDANSCLRATTRLAAVAGSTKKISSITFSVDGKSIGTAKADAAGIAFKDWNPKKAKKGKHQLRATAKDAGGRTVSATRTVRTGCTK
jgi:hypothetical protein